MVYVLVLGAMASVLGEMKFFPVAAFALAGLGFLLYVMKGGQIVRLVPYVILLGIVVLVFIVGYNTFVPGADEKPLESFILDPNVLNGYTNQLHRSDVESGVYIMGRTRALKYGWSTINRDPITLLIGFGLGARSESVALGSEGIAFQLALRRYTTRSSLLVFMQELGVLGLLAIATVILWIAIRLFRDIKHDPGSPITELRYALLLFTLFLPIWLWYSTTNMYAVTMLLYWGSLGYVLGESYRQSKAGYKSYLENSLSQKREEPAL